MPVVAEFEEFDEDLTLPVFRPIADGPTTRETEKS